MPSKTGYINKITLDFLCVLRKCGVVDFSGYAISKERRKNKIPERFRVFIK